MIVLTFDFVLVAGGIYVVFFLFTNRSKIDVESMVSYYFLFIATFVALPYVSCKL